jgi:hypothetical protein
MARVWRELIRELTRDEQPVGDLHPESDFFTGATPMNWPRLSAH